MTDKLFEYPEVRTIFNHLFDEVLEESPRGAVIIGATIVDDHLTNFISSILPYVNPKDKDKLFKYPNPLSSFSAKIEMAFAFRLINENLYRSLNELRHLRNRAAHTSSTFSLEDFRLSLDKIFNIGPSIAIQIRNQALQMTVDLKFNIIKEVFDEAQLEQTDQERALKIILEDKELLSSIEEQVPHMELVYGLSLICGILSSKRADTLHALGESKTWSELNKAKKSYE